MSVARKAEEAVVDREARYGPAVLNHACTAALWSAYLGRRFGVAFELDAEDVCWLNVLQKASRDANRREEDNRVDGVGYLLNAETVRTAPAAR